MVAVFGLTANTVTAAIYYSAVPDGNDQPMTGAQRYTMSFTEPMNYLKPLPPSFWSVTMYDSVTRYSVPNPISRYSLGSDNDLKKNADGSFTLYISMTIRGRIRSRIGCLRLLDRFTSYCATMRQCPKSPRDCKI
jgi:DNA sulfur modification protein DndE